MSQAVTELAAGPAPLGHVVLLCRRVLAVLWVLAILTVCWIPADWMRHAEGDSGWFGIPHFDKIIHGGIFVVFSVLWLRLGSSPRRYGWVVLGGLALAVVSEVVQNVPWIGRDASVGDALVDVLGVVVGLAVAPLIEPLLLAVESRLFRGSTV
jgi:VanZ family protein